MEEIWKDIDGCNGVYQISNMGNVKSLNYMNHGIEKILKPKKNNKGYLWVEIRKNGEIGNFLVHRLVAMAFIKNPNNYPVVNHKDENTLNNNIDNLEWCTKSYNVRYSLERHPERKRRDNIRESEKYRRHKKKLLMIDNEGKVVNTFESVCSYCKETNRNSWSIIECCNGNRKTAYGYKWKFAD